MNLVVHFILPVLLVTTCKKTLFQNCWRFSCNIQKFEYWQNNPWESWKVAKPFLQHYLEHCRVKKYPRIQYHALLAKRNASLATNTESALIAMGFEQFYEFQNLTYPWTFQDIRRTVWHFRMYKVHNKGLLHTTPGSQEKSMNSWCVSFETECMFVC